MAKDRLIADGGGLYLRVLPSGFESWLFIYGFNGSRRKLALGGTSDISLAAARSAAARERANIANGIDPRVALMTQEAEQHTRREALEAAEARRKQDASTFRDMFDAWMANGVQRADENAELRRTFEKDILPRVGDKPVRAVGDTDLRDALRKVGRSRKRGRTAERMLSEIRQMYRWSIKRPPWKDLLSDGNPAELVEAKQVVFAGYETIVRDRVLKPNEIIELRDILAASQREYATAEDRRSAIRPLQRETQLALWICLATACRIGELLKARWEHVNLEVDDLVRPEKQHQDTHGLAGFSIGLCTTRIQGVARNDEPRRERFGVVFSREPARRAHRSQDGLEAGRRPPDEVQESAAVEEPT